jgi:hypothetical protein
MKKFFSDVFQDATGKYSSSRLKSWLAFLIGVGMLFKSTESAMVLFSYAFLEKTGNKAFEKK